MFTIIIIAAKAARKFSSVAAAAAALLAAGWSETVQAETLASWTLTGKLNSSSYVVADDATLNSAISLASLARAEGTTKAGNDNIGFGVQGFTKGQTNAYLEMSFVIAPAYKVTLDSLSYALYKGNTGPSPFFWKVYKNEVEVNIGSSPIELTATDPSSPQTGTLNLSSLGELSAGSSVKLVLHAVSNYKGRHISFCSTMSLAGIAVEEKISELTLYEIDDKIINFGETTVATESLSAVGNNGEDVSFFVSATDKNGDVFTGVFGIENGVFSYTPAKADAELSPITFTIEASTATQTAEPQSFDVTVNVIPPAIGEITAQQCYAGDTNIVALTLSGDYAEAGEIVSTNAICQTYGVTGQFSTNITEGVFWYAPNVDDIATAEQNEGVIEFKVVLTVGDLSATNEFTVAVSEKPDFFEGFEKIKTSTTYINTENTIFEGDAASWRGTNYLVNGRATDNFRGTRAVCFRESGTAYIEMSTSKANGAGTVSFWHGRVPNDTTQTTNLLDVLISNNGGSTWNSLTEDAIVVSNEFVKTTIDDVNVGGNVMLRFEKTYGNKRMYIDDIIITDYEGQAEIEPAIGEIADQTIRADESVEIRIMFYGDNGLTKSVECTTSGVASEEYGFDAATGDFSFAPSLADLALNDGVIEFTAYLKEGDNVRASRSFSVTLLPPLPKWLELRPNVYIKENFNGMGSGKNAELPPPWRVAYTNTPMCYAALDYDSASTTNTQTATFGASTKNAGIYNLGEETTSEDRAVGFLSSSDKFITCALVVPFKNTTSSAITGFNVSFKWEKWRTGNAKKLDLRYSTGAPNWEWTSVESFHREYGAAEGETAAWVGSENELLRKIETKTEKGRVEIEIPAGGMVYLGWFYSADTKSVSGSAQCWAVDDVRISAGNPDMTVIMMK